MDRLLCLMFWLYLVAGVHLVLVAGVHAENPTSRPTVADPPKRRIPAATQPNPSQTSTGSTTRPVWIAPSTKPVLHHTFPPTTHATRQTPTTHATRQTPTTHATRQTPTTHATRQIPTTHATRQIPTTHATRQIPTTRPKHQVPTTHTVRQTPTTRPTTGLTSVLPKARVVPIAPRTGIISVFPKTQISPKHPSVTPGMAPLALPFDAKTGAVALQMGVVHTKLSQIGGVSWFTVHIAKRGWYLIDTLGQSDPFCRLYGKDFALISRNDDSGENRNCRLFLELAAGSYYLEVMLFPFKSTSFQVIYHAVDINTLAMGQKQSSRIGKRGELKLFQVQVEKEGLYTLSTEGKTDVVCALLDTSSSDLNFRAVDDDSGPGTNCSLSQVLRPGKYIYLVRGAYFYRQGEFSIHFRSEVEDRLKFYAITFGEQMRAKLDSARHRHRYHFRLLQRQRVSFLAVFQRNTPQLLLRDVNGSILVDAGYAAHHQGKVSILTKFLDPGEYYLEVRSPGKPYAPYLLWGHKDQDAEVVPNHALLFAAGVPTSIDWNPYEYGLFRVKLHGQKYHTVETKHPAAVACFLENAEGHVLMKRQVSLSEPGICRIEGHQRQGTHWVRVLLHHKKRPPTRLPDTGIQRGMPERTSSPPVAPNQEKPTKPAEPWWQKDEFEKIRDLRDEETKGYAKDWARHVVPGHATVVGTQRAVSGHATTAERLYVWNTNPAPQVYFFEWKPIPLALGQVQRVQSEEDSVGIRLDVNQSDLYWFSARNGEAQDCKIQDLFLRFLKQTSVFPNGCDVAAYLLRGSYLVRMTTKHQTALDVDWRTFRSFPTAMSGKQILVGPIKQGDIRRFRTKVTQAGFYRVETHLVSPVTLVARVKLYHQGKLFASPHTKSYRVISFLPEGDYEIGVQVVQGRGAYTLTQVRKKTRILHLGQPVPGRFGEQNNKHHYAVTVKQTRNYRFEIRGGADLFCRLYSDKGVLIGSGSATSSRPICQIERMLQPGVHLLEVGSAFGNTTLYQLTWQGVLLKPSNTLELKKIRTGRLVSRVDAHRYSIQIQRPGTYIIETRNPPGTNTDPKCYLYKDNRLMRYNDDGGQKFNCKIVTYLATGQYSLLIRLAWSTRSGPYSVAIYPSGESFPGDTGQPPARRVVISPRRATSPPRTGSGLVLRPGLRTQALVVRRNRVDIYVLHIDYAGRYRIETDGNLDTKCFLDDHRENIVAVDEDGGQGANCRIRVRLPAGSYFIRVLARPHGRMGPYGIRIDSE